VIEPKMACLYVPHGLSRPKANLFDRIGSKLGKVVRGNVAELASLPDDVTPIVGCSPELTPLIAKWRSTNRRHCYWDRGYFLRVYATHTPRGENGGMFRWHMNSYQLQSLRDVPGDRWKAAYNQIRKSREWRWSEMKPDGMPWQTSGAHIVVAMPTPTYSRFHGLDNWTETTIAELKKYTDRKIITRDKEDKRPLQEDLKGAHALVAHGSIAAVESVICGAPVFVCADSAASLVGQTDLSKIETPVYPDRQMWLNNLAANQWCEAELTDGTLWRMLGS
jgi:hypothetical protein